MNIWNRDEQPVRFYRRGWYFQLSPLLPAEDFAQFLETVDSSLSSGTTLKDSRTTTAAIRDLPPVGPVFLKRTNRKGFRFILRYLFRRARSFRAAAATNALIRAGIETPAVLAVGEHRTGLLLHAGYIINEALEDARSCHGLLARTDSPAELLTPLTGKATALLTELHRRNIVHGDYKLSNLYWTPTGKPGTWDLDGAAILAAPSRRRMTEDLYRLASSIRQVLNKYHPAFRITDRELCEIIASGYAGPVPISAGTLCALLRRERK